MLQYWQRIALALAVASACAGAQTSTPKNATVQGSSQGNSRSGQHSSQSAAARTGRPPRPAGPNPVFWLDLATSLAEGKSSQVLSAEVAARGTDLYFDDGDAEYLRALGATDALIRALRNARFVYVDYTLDPALWESAATRDEAAIRLALSKHPEDAALTWLLAVTFQVEGKQVEEKRSEAILEARKAIELKPDLACAHRTLSELQLDTGQNQEALAEAQETVRLMPNVAAPHYLLGTALVATGDAPGGIAEFRKAVQLAPDYYLSHYVLGDYLFGQKNYDEAAHEFREAVRLNPAFAIEHFGLGRVLLEKQDYDGAAFEFKEALRLNPKDIYIYGWLSSALFRAGQFDEAAAEARVALLYDPKSPSAKKLFVAAQTSLRQTGGAGVQQPTGGAGTVSPSPQGGDAASAGGTELAGTTWKCTGRSVYYNGDSRDYNFTLTFLARPNPNSSLCTTCYEAGSGSMPMEWAAYLPWTQSGSTFSIPYNYSNGESGPPLSGSFVDGNHLQMSHPAGDGTAGAEDGAENDSCERANPLPPPGAIAKQDSQTQSFPNHPPYDDRCLRTGQGSLGSVTVTNICTQPIDLKFCYRKQGDDGPWTCKVTPRLEPNHTLQSPFCEQCAYDGRAAAYLSSRNLLNDLPSDAEVASWMGSGPPPGQSASASGSQGSSDGQRQWRFVNPAQNWDTLTFEIRGRNGDSTSDDWNDEATLQTVTLKPGQSWTEDCGSYFSLDIKWQLASASDPQVDTFYNSLVCYANNFVWNNNHNLREYDFPRQ